MIIFSTITLVLGTPNFSAVYHLYCSPVKAYSSKNVLAEKLINFRFSCKKNLIFGRIFIFEQKTDEPLSQIRLFFIDSIFKYLLIAYCRVLLRRRRCY